MVPRAAVGGRPAEVGGRRSCSWSPILLVIAGLAIDAFTCTWPPASVLTQGDLLCAEAELAIIAALALVVRPRRWTALITFLASGGGFAAVNVFQFVNVDAVGPRRTCTTRSDAERTLSARAGQIAALAALALLVLEYRHIPHTAPRTGRPRERRPAAA
jgi:hypothetical protein